MGRSYAARYARGNAGTASCQDPAYGGKEIGNRSTSCRRGPFRMQESTLEERAQGHTAARKSTPCRLGSAHSHLRGCREQRCDAPAVRRSNANHADEERQAIGVCSRADHQGEREMEVSGVGSDLDGDSLVEVWIHAPDLRFLERGHAGEGRLATPDGAAVAYP